MSRKNSYLPYRATGDTVKLTLTDMDTFPYPRWYRGVRTSNLPTIMEREAGFREVTPIDRQPIEETPRPEYTYSLACSTYIPPKKDQCVNFSL